MWRVRSPSSWPRSIENVIEQHKESKGRSKAGTGEIRTAQDLPEVEEGSKALDSVGIANVDACCGKTQESNLPREVSDEEDIPDVLESPHETRESARVAGAPSLPVEGQPHVCKQEAAEVVVTAVSTNGMVKTVSTPNELVSVDRMATLDIEPARIGHGVGAKETRRTTYLMHTECHSRGSNSGVRTAARRTR